MSQRTFVLLKPDTVKRGLVGAVVQRFEDRGLRIVAMEHRTIDGDLADQHYAEHVGKPFYAPLVEFMGSGELVAVVVEGHRAIEGIRTIIGATDPTAAAPGSIRGDLAADTGEKVQRNLVHASDSPESAEREIGLWFPTS